MNNNNDQMTFPFPTFESTIESAIQEGKPISDDLLRETSRKVGRSSGVAVLPSHLTSFFSDLSRTYGAKKVLDVWAGMGILARAIASNRSVEAITAITLKNDDIKIANLIQGSGKETFILGEPKEWLLNNREKYDLVVGALPLSADRAAEEFKTSGGVVTILDGMGEKLMLRSFDHLSAEGRGIFLISQKFSFEQRINSVRANLINYGVYLNALIFYRDGTFSLNAHNNGYVAVLSKKKTDKLFVAELSEIPDRNKAIIKFLYTGTEGKDPSLGRWVEESEFRGWDSYRAELELTKWLQQSGYSTIRISDIVTEINVGTPNRCFEDKPNAVYIPMMGVSNAMTSRFELKMKEHNYLQLVVDPSRIEPRFLTSFFNSAKGREVRSAYAVGSAVPRITRRSILNGIIYYPPKAEQLAIVDVETKLNNFQNQLDEWRSKLSDEPGAVQEVSQILSSLERKEDFEVWIDQLPLPLATILWHYHVRNEDSKSRYGQLLHFFEALTEFVATILISGFRSNPTTYEKMKSDFQGFLRQGSFEQSTFATWVLVVENLGALGRKVLTSWDPNNKESEVPDELRAFKTESRPFFDMIFSERLLAVLKRANAYRNLWLGHSGAVDEVEANHRRVELEALVSECRATMGRAWAAFQMVRAVSLRFSNEVYLSKVERLMGVRVPFVVSEVEAVEPLDDQKLYLFDQTTRRGLEIAPFVKVIASPRSAQTACYFYNRADRDGVRFVTYYFGSDSEIVEAFPETRQLVAELLPQKQT